MIVDHDFDLVAAVDGVGGSGLLGQFFQDLELLFPDFGRDPGMGPARNGSAGKFRSVVVISGPAVGITSGQQKGGCQDKQEHPGPIQMKDIEYHDSASSSRSLFNLADT